MPTPVDTVIEAARGFLGERITTNATLREHHSHGQDTQPPALPDAVAFVETSEEAARLLALRYAQQVPIVPWGAGTSLEGHVTPVRGGITLDLSRMTSVLDVSQADMDCRVQAGVTNIGMVTDPTQGDAAAEEEKAKKKAPTLLRPGETIKDN